MGSIGVLIKRGINRKSSGTHEKDSCLFPEFLEFLKKI